MKPLSRIASWFALALMAASAQALPQDLASKLDEALKDWNVGDAPAGVASVSVKGKVVYEKAFGLANLELGVPNTTETIFDVGSISKQFTATCVMLLQDDGKLKIDEEAAKYLPDYPLLSDNKITVRELMSHTAGVRDYMSLMAFKTGALAFGDDDVTATLQRQRTLNFAAGSAWDYSNSGFYLLKKIVEKVSGKSLAEFAKERVFGPLGMTHSQFMDDPSKVIHGRAFGYVPVEKEYAAGLSMIAADGAGGLWTTLEDMHKWTQNWKNNKLGKDPEMFSSMQTPTKLRNGKDTGYGLGFFIDEYKGVRRIQHGGDFIGFHAQVCWYPDQDIVITTFSNDGTQNAKEFNDRMAEVMLEGVIKQDATAANKEIALTEAELDEYIGKYDLPGGSIEIKREGTQLKAQVTGQPAFDVFASAKDHFFLKIVQATIDFERDDAGNVASLTLHQGTAIVPCPRTKAFTMPADRLDAFVGLYYSEELDVVINIKRKNGLLVAVSDTIFDLFPLGFASEKQMTAGPLTVDVTWDGQDVRALTVNMPRARGMKFVRMSSPPPAS